MSSNTRAEPSRYKIDFSSLMVYSSTSDELSFREGKWTQSTRCFELLSRRTRNIPATTRCRILATSAWPRLSCSHTGHVLMSFSRMLMPRRRGRQFFGVAGRQSPMPSSSSSSSPLPTTGTGPVGSPRAGAPACRIMPPAAPGRGTEELRRRAERNAESRAPACPWLWPSGRAGPQLPPRSGALAPFYFLYRSERGFQEEAGLGGQGFFCQKPFGSGSRPRAPWGTPRTRRPRPRGRA